MAAQMNRSTSTNIFQYIEFSSNASLSGSKYGSKYKLEERKYRPSKAAKAKRTGRLEVEEEVIEIQAPLNYSTWYLFFAAIAANLLGFSNGIAYGWTSPVLPVLASNDTELNPLENPNTAADNSWVASLLCLGAAIGPVMAGFCANYYGRKMTLILVSLPMIAMYLILAFAKNVIFFFVARFILGISVGCIYTVIPMFIAEIAETNNRGQLGCFLSVLQTIGMLFCYSIGPFVSIKILSFLCLIPLFIFLVIFGFFIPESPYYLVSKGNLKAAELSLAKIRVKSPEEIQFEIDQIAAHIKESTENKKTYRDIFTDKANVKALYISGALMFIQELSGISIVLSYMQTIFDETESKIPSHYCTIIVGLVQVFVTIFTSQLIDRLGRKILLVISSVIGAMSLASLGCYFYFKQAGADVTVIDWLPVISLMTYILAYNLGIGPVGWAIMGEIFAPNIKVIASTITVFIYFLFGFATTVLFPILNDYLTIAGSFGLFSLCCVLATGFIIVFVPETKGKTLAEIQTLLKS